MRKIFEGPKEMRQFVVLPKWWPRLLFYLGHGVVIGAGLYFIREFRGGRLDLTWQFLVLLGATLLPFLLAILSPYLRSVGPLVFRDPEPPDTGVVKGEVPELNNAPAAPPMGPGDEEVGVLIEPNFAALTLDEKRLLKLLWKGQINHVVGGGEGWWGFRDHPTNPTYPSFVSAFSDLFQRKMVQQNPDGLVFLTPYGLGYCNRHIPDINAVADFWVRFGPNRD